MKVLKIGVFAFLIAAVLLCSNAIAGQREGAFSLSPMIGYHWFEGDQKTEDGWNLGFSLGYNISKHWAAEVEFRYTDSKREMVATNDDLDVVSAGVNALYHFNPDGTFVPYLSAGFGALFFDWSGDNHDLDDEDYMMNWGVGAKVFFAEDLGLRLDVRHLIDLHSDRVWDQGGGDDTDHNVVAALGLYWQFGGPEPVAEPPKDSDADGIQDIRDKCPDTPLGVMVDAVGCPPVSRKSRSILPAAEPNAMPAKKVAPVVAPVPMVGDDDGDGVANSSDNCPDTAKGDKVDENGCPLRFVMQIEFDFDKSEVRPAYHQKLHKAADFIKKYPDTVFLLAGHTDSRGSEKYNQRLSQKRAAAVKKYLVEKFGIAAHLVTDKGFGESQPIASNMTRDGRQKNRRVEILLDLI